MVIGKYKGI